jgi:hypothetical protein
MTHRSALLLSLAVVVVLGAPGARADAPLRTDNGEVPEQGNCKVESWYEGTPHQRAYVVAPTCNPFGRVELGAALVRSRDADRAWSNQAGVQAKVEVLRKRDDLPLAIATTLAAGYDGAAEGRRLQTATLNVPVTFYPDDDRWRIHLNAGALWRRDGRDAFTFGAAAEFASGAVTWLGEVYHPDTGRPSFNLGARFDLAEGLALYAGGGRRFGADPDGWLVTIGLKLESPSFLK